MERARLLKVAAHCKGRPKGRPFPIQPGAKRPIEREQLSQALGPDVIDELTAKTGLFRGDILERLTRDLPKALDDLTPEGRVPSEADARWSNSAMSTSRPL